MEKLTSPHVLVTGGAGYIGRHVRSLLPNSLSFDVREGTGRLSEFNERDAQWENIECVVHLADLRLGDFNAENLKTNIQQQKDFLSKVAHLPRLKKLIFSSSCSVYGFSEHEINDHSPVSPTSFYAESKIATEHFIESLNMPHQIFRFGTAFGQSTEMRRDLFVNMLCEAAVKGARLEIFSADAWRPYIHCLDFARTLIHAIHAPHNMPKNALSSNYTKAQILDLPLLRNSNLQVDLSSKGDPRNYKVQIPLNFQSGCVSMEDGIQEMMGALKC